MGAVLFGGVEGVEGIVNSLKVKGRLITETIGRAQRDELFYVAVQL